MPVTQFDRDAQALWYAREHLKTDPGVVAVHYLKNSPKREIWFIEVNKLIGELLDESLEPIDFGVDYGMGNEHKLFILDVTPQQWDRIQKTPSLLPNGWSLKDAVELK
jgi:hypothetical protein